MPGDARGLAGQAGGVRVKSAPPGDRRAFELWLKEVFWIETARLS